MNSNVVKAIAIILFGIAAFDIMGVIVRLLGNNYPILQISVLRNLFGIIPSIVILMLGPGLSDLKKNKYGLLLENYNFQGSSCTFGTILFLYFTYKN